MDAMSGWLLQALIDSVHGNLQDAQVQMMKDQLLQTTGVDISNPEHIREESCALASEWPVQILDIPMPSLLYLSMPWSIAGVNSIADFAEKAGIPESYMRQFYPSFVDSINMVRDMLRDSIDQPYIPAESKTILRACLRFYDTMDEIGLLSLN